MSSKVPIYRYIMAGYIIFRSENSLVTASQSKDAAPLAFDAHS